MASRGFKKQLASQKQWLDVGVRKLHGKGFSPAAREAGEAVEDVAWSGLLGTLGSLWYGVNARGGFEGELEVW